MPDRVLIPTRVVVEAKQVLASAVSDRAVRSTARRLAAGGEVQQEFLVGAAQWAPGPIAARWMGNPQPQVEVEARKAAIDYSDGIMIALMLPLSLAETIAVPDGQPPAELHITLSFLGSVDAVDDDSDFLLRCLGAVRDVARYQEPLTGLLSGIGRFSGDETDVVYLSADIPGLEDFRYHLCEALEQAEVTVEKNHGFTPHCTVAYISRDAEMPIRRLDPRALEFSEVVIVYGLNQIPVPFGGDEITSDPGLGGAGDPLPTTTSATVNRGDVNRTVGQYKAFPAAAPTGQAAPQKQPPGPAKQNQPPQHQGPPPVEDPEQDQVDETNRKAAFETAVLTAETAERRRRAAVEMVIDAETDDKRKAALEAAEKDAQKLFDQRMKTMKGAERTRRRSHVRKTRVKKQQQRAEKDAAKQQAASTAAPKVPATAPAGEAGK